MSDVYLARDTLLDRPVAVKVLFPEYARDPTFVERFRREAQAAARLTHGYIVAIYDWGEELGTYFIVMEYVEGRSLSEVLRDQGPLPAEQAAQVALDVAIALGFAHRNGVVHRDVKPGNILISPIGEVKVADFGIAQALTGGEQVNLTQTGAVMGTATYFSPEQAQGNQVDPRSDLYSLGCVLFEMLTGQPPFAGETPVAIAYNHVQKQPPTTAEMGVAVPEGLEAIIQKLLRKEPSLRYSSAEELRDDLRRFLDGVPVRALGDMAGAGLAAAGPATTAMAATSAIPATGGVPPAVAGAPPAYEEPEEPRRKRSGWLIAITILLLALLAAALFLIGSNLSNDGPSEVVVPTVTNLSEEDATAELEAAELEVRVELQPNDSVEAGIVFDQSPSSGSRVDEGSTVTITVSEGAGEVAVPDVVGRSEADASDRIRQAGLDPEPSRQEHDDVPEGEVISQDPTPGTEVEVGSTVAFVVSDGASTVAVPDVVSMTETAASNRLGQENLLADPVREESDSVPPGVVIRTDPAAGDRIAPGSTVQIVVAEAPPETTTTTTTTSTTSTTTTSSTTTTTQPDGNGGGGGGGNQGGGQGNQ